MKAGWNRNFVLGNGRGTLDNVVNRSTLDIVPKCDRIGVLITLTDIAQAADVSPNTVSRVLQGVTYRRPSFQRRAEHIRRLAEELGYRPNTAARATRKGRFSNVGLLVSTSLHRSHLPEAMLAAICDHLTGQDLSLSLIRLPDAKLADGDLVPRLLRQRGCDGLLIDYTHGIPGPLIDLIAQLQVPAVWLNTKRDTDAVFADDFEAGQRAGQHLLRHGCRRTAYLSSLLDGQPTHYSESDRPAGYAQALAAAGLTPQVVTHLRRDERIAWLVHELQRGQLDGVVCYSNRHVMEVVRAAQLAGADRMALRALAVFESDTCLLDAATKLLPVPEAAVGRAGAQMLLRKLASPREPLPSQPVCFDH